MNLENHGREIYKNPQWPTSPLFYLCAPSVTDNSVAPANCENLFFLIPIAPDLEDTEQNREKYFNILLERLEKRTEIRYRKIYYKKSFCIDDFKRLQCLQGMHMALQIHLNKLPSSNLNENKNKKLYYTGQLTIPGPGVPPSIISGR